MTSKERSFVTKVWQHYQEAGRHNLPWRRTHNPYRILVSEIMLQQTQVDRVLPKYRSFLKRFPSLRTLASASLGEVLRAWQGLGYNRRAKMLHDAAREIVEKFRGRTPKSLAELQALPGVGAYTGGAVLAFAYNIPIPITETNIRTAIIHHFFRDANNISDRDVRAIVERTLDRERPREWYYALMDYGAHLKKTVGNENKRSRHYARQSTFRGSNREIRGAIIRLLTHRAYTRAALLKQLPFEDVRIDTQLSRLSQEKLIMRMGKSYHLPR